MKRGFIELVVVVCLGLAGVQQASACGDKIVDINQGVQFQRAIGMEPAAILIYVDADSVTRSVKRLRASLSRVGHDVELVSDRQVAIEALQRGEYDLVIAELDEATAMEALLGPGSSPPVLLPLVLDGTEAELQQARGENPFVLAVPGKDNEHILTVGEALGAREPAAGSTL